MIRLFRCRPRYAVVWWPSPLYVDVPELIGPFTSRRAGLRARDAVRARQRRPEKMAQLARLDPPAPERATAARRPALRAVTA